MNQPFYLIVTSASCNINVVSEQYQKPGDLNLGLVEESSVKK
ncbi:MAG: hypothetical protein OSB15_04940 [Amylibacter sp.]|nr:hypothetical protein [Amylibacter sp.]|tara:strand:- start:503 stop:628 length:126 start_codon:yes stop_codon:yes gene_type:complete